MSLNKTSIEYMTHSWNPISMLCTPLSEGCAHCWHRAMAARLAKNPLLSFSVRAAYSGQSPPLLNNSRLSDPITYKPPSIIGVQFMGDLFHPSIQDKWIDNIFCTMAIASHHWFIVLTKYPHRMLDYLSTTWPNPLPNVIGMVSVELQKYSHRIDKLMSAPLALRGVSLGPLLDYVDISTYVHALDWVILEDESGPGRRPCDLDFARTIRDLCHNACTPFFFKQWHINNIRISMPALDGCQYGQYPHQLYETIRLNREKQHAK